MSYDQKGLTIGYFAWVTSQAAVTRKEWKDAEYNFGTKIFYRERETPRDYTKEWRALDDVITIWSGGNYKKKMESAAANKEEYDGGRTIVKKVDQFDEVTTNLMIGE